MPLHVLHAHFLASIWITTVWARESIHTVLSQLGCYYGMCISIFFFGSCFFFLCFRWMHGLPSVRSQGTLRHSNILHYADFVPFTVSFSSVGFQVQVVPFLVYEKRRYGLYVLLLDFVPSVFVFYCICNIRSFSKRRTDSKENDFFFLNLTIIDCIVGGLFKNRVKFVSANSFVCGSYVSLGTFLNRFPLRTKRREHSIFLISRRSPWIS